MLRPSSPADQDREATHTGSARMSASVVAESPTPAEAADPSKSPSGWPLDPSGQLRVPPTFKQDINSVNAKSAARRRSSFIPFHVSKRHGAFAPANVVLLARKVIKRAGGRRGMRGGTIEKSSLAWRLAHWHTPLSCQTTPHGHPVAPGAQLALAAQFMQLPLEHVQLCPLRETCVPS